MIEEVACGGKGGAMEKVWLESSKKLAPVSELNPTRPIYSAAAIFPVNKLNEKLGNKVVECQNGENEFSYERLIQLKFHRADASAVRVPTSKNVCLWARKSFDESFVLSAAANCRADVE